MKIFFASTALTLLFFSSLVIGCAGNSSSTKDNISVKDDLALHGNCIISGKLLDKNTNEPIRDANVVLYSKPVSAVTDLYGQFEMSNILPGTYTLQFFCVGYVQKDIPEIKAKPNRLIELNVRLEPRSSHGE